MELSNQERNVLINAVLRNMESYIDNNWGIYNSQSDNKFYLSKVDYMIKLVDKIFNDNPLDLDDEEKDLILKSLQGAQKSIKAGIVYFDDMPLEIRENMSNLLEKYIEIESKLF